MTKFKFDQAMSLPDIRTFLATELPEYDVTVKNSLVEYVEVKSSSFVGVWIRIKKNQVLIFGGIPSAMARAAFGPMWIPLFLRSSFNRLESEVARHIEGKYKVDRV